MEMQLINNYGLFWQADWVHWGYGGHLKGIRKGAKKGDPIDFRYQVGVYCLYDDSFRLVYIGQAGGGKDHWLFNRLNEHRSDSLSSRWSRFSWFGIRRVLKTGGKLQAQKQAAHPSIKNVLDHIEAILIASAEPVQNRQGGRFGNGVEQYLQYRHEKSLGPDMEAMIRSLWKKSNKT